ncbi:unnamed protein product [Sphagnum jensenii]|uniref:Uncharacterized protein n=1 Tax=Sphagnum jensenii TaxID=128206 RepID=A0ABP0X9E7_9BRYO
MPSGEQCLFLPTRDLCWPLIEGAAAAPAEVVNLSVGSGLKGSRRTTRPCSLSARGKESPGTLTMMENCLTV